MSVVVKMNARAWRRRACAFVVAAGLFVCAGGSEAWSFEVIETRAQEVPQAAAVMRAPDAESPAGDACLYILRHAQEREGFSERERYYRPDAGSAAAVGLVFGVRFALGPSELNKSRRRAPVQTAALRVWEPRESAGGARALAIADYRACRNERALRALTD